MNWGEILNNKRKSVFYDIINTDDKDVCPRCREKRICLEYKNAKVGYSLVNGLIIIYAINAVINGKIKIFLNTWKIIKLIV